MKKLPIGLQNFQKIVEDDFLYIDKTRQIHELIGMGSLYFLSPPRRFGKSLLISILKQVSGTPTFLVEILRNKRISASKIETKEVTDTFFDKFSIKNLDIYSLLFQTGYLTVSSVRYRPNSVRLIYSLDYPNQEVKEAFVHNFLSSTNNNETIN